MNYISVDPNTSSVSVDPSLSTDVAHQLLTWVGQGINLVFSFIVPLIGVLIILGFLYWIYYFITKRLARK